MDKTHNTYCFLLSSLVFKFLFFYIFFSDFIFLFHERKERKSPSVKTPPINLFENIVVPFDFI